MAKPPAAPTPDAVMSGPEMKPVLAKSKKEPVACAFGLTEGKDGVILLNAKKAPKKVFADLKANAKAAGLKLETSSLRFGMAEVDTDVDSSLVIFTINKEPPGGIEAKLKLQLKGSGCTKVEFRVDGGLEADEHDEAQTEGEPAPPVAATAAAAETQAAPPPPPPPPPQAAAPQAAAPASVPDAAALGKQLATLIPQIPQAGGTDANLLQSLKGLAATAMAALKGGNLSGAASGIDDLRRAIAAAGQPRPATQAQGGPVAYAKSRLAWLAARNKAASDIEKLRGEIVATYQADGLAAELDQAYRNRVAPVLATLDESLADTLDAATKEADAGKRAALVAEAKATIDKYSQFLASETLFADLDENPFVPLAIRTTIGGTLAALAKAIH